MSSEHWPNKALQHNSSLLPDNLTTAWQPHNCRKAQR